MGCGPLFANVLPNLKFFEPSDDGRPEDHGKEERCKAGVSRPEGNVTEKVQQVKVRVELEVKVVEHRD